MTSYGVSEKLSASVAMQYYTFINIAHRILKALYTALQMGNEKVKPPPLPKELSVMYTNRVSSLSNIISNSSSGSISANNINNNANNTMKGKVSVPMPPNLRKTRNPTPSSSLMSGSAQRENKSATPPNSLPPLVNTNDTNNQINNDVKDNDINTANSNTRSRSSSSSSSSDSSNAVTQRKGKRVSLVDDSFRCALVYLDVCCRALLNEGVAALDVQGSENTLSTPSANRNKLGQRPLNTNSSVVRRSNRM